MALGGALAGLYAFCILHSLAGGFEMALPSRLMAWVHVFANMRILRRFRGIGHGTGAIINFFAKYSVMLLTTDPGMCKYNVNTLHGHYIYN